MHCQCVATEEQNAEARELLEGRDLRAALRLALAADDASPRGGAEPGGRGTGVTLWASRCGK